MRYLSAFYVMVFTAENAEFAEEVLMASLRIELKMKQNRLLNNFIEGREYKVRVMSVIEFIKEKKNR